MTYDTIADIIELLVDKGFDRKYFVRTVTQQMRQQADHYVCLKIGAAVSDSEPLDSVDYLRLTVEVCMGKGENGAIEGARVSDRLYRKLRLLHNVFFPGTVYLNIAAKNPPYESYNGDYTVYTFPVDIIRFNVDDHDVVEPDDGEYHHI